MTTFAENPLILVDGSSYLYRAFHASPDFTNAKGEPTGAVYGVVNMLRSLVRQYPQSDVVVIFDAKGKTFRDDLYPNYKANRPPMPDELRNQIKPLHAIIEAMGFPMLVIEGVEADDVIGTLSHQGSQAGMSILISTGDKDMAQLVNPNVRLINTMKNELLDVEAVRSKYGFGPEYMIDYLALMGDKVDNIPGVKGVGEKIATALIRGVGGLEDIYANLEKIETLTFRGAKTLGKKLLEHKEDALLSYTLATIKLDCELPKDIAALKNGTADSDKLIALFTELNFKRWLSEVQNGDASVEAIGAKIRGKKNENESPVSELSPIERGEYETIFDKEAFARWLNAIKQSSLVAFDTETDNLDYMEANLIGISFAISVSKAAYIPLAHDYLGVEDQLDRDWVLSELKDWLEDPSAAKVGQNLKYDASVLARYDIHMQGIDFDTMLASYVYNSVSGRHDMDSLAKRYLNHECISFESLAGKGKNQRTFNQIEIEQATEYAAEDADVTLHLHQTLQALLDSDKKLLNIYKTLEMPLVPVLSRMERQGVKICSTMLAEQSKVIGARLKELEAKAYVEAGEEFNLSSPKQLQVILFEKLNLPVLKKTPTGAASTNEEVLQELALDYPLPKCILEYRGLAKLKSTYTDKLPKMVNAHSKRVHTSYHQAVTATGRLSSTDPNLQNIPIRTEEGRKIRQAFIASEGRKIVAIDYSQIELRIMAHLSEDKALVEAFNQGKDIHSATAAEIMGVELSQVTTEMRRRAKAINFGLIYGMSAFGLAKQLGIPRGEAQEYMNSYFEKYPGVKQYMESTRLQASEQGYVETIFGRRLYLPEIKSSNAMRRKGAERAAINAPMQGSAADIIKKAMIAVDAWIQSEGKGKAILIMQVHDELVFEIVADCHQEIAQTLSQIMEKAADLSVPLLVEVGVGDNWDQAH